MYIKVISSLLATFALICNSATADSDIDFNNGTVYVETDHHDDLIFILPEGDRLAIYILQMHEDTFLLAQELRQFIYQNWPNGVQTRQEWIEFYEDMAERDRVWRRDIEDVDRVIVSSASGSDAIIAEDTLVDLVVYAGDHQDLISGSQGRNYLFGEWGNDDITIRSVAVSVTSYISGGGHGDRIQYYGDSPILIDGGSENDVINVGASTGDALIWGQGGDDKIYCGSGNDTVYAGDGFDRVYGGPGNDEIYGGHGYDALHGDGGNDFIEGGYDGYDDALYGGSGFDEVVAFYFRYPSSRFPNKSLMIKLEEEIVFDAEILSGIEK